MPRARRACLGRVVAAGRVLGRDRQLAARARARERGVGVDHLEVDLAADEAQRVLGSSAPGSRPASQSTWKPLQIPSTRPPSRANSTTDSMTGEKRAIAPTRR